MDTSWFVADKEGLRELLERRGKAFIVFELLQNAWDEKTSEVTATLTPIPGASKCLLVVTDDNPDGFADLRHAYTLFADSAKKGNPEQRGRFNLGEKLVLACCDKAEVTSTTGCVVFDNEGRRNSRKRTERGTVFEATVLMTRGEYADACKAVEQLIPPQDIKTNFNGRPLKRPKMVTTFEAPLPTEIADEEGLLRRTTRTTKVEVYEPLPDHPARIYEMGIPVVETGDRFHINVLQKVPLNFERDNVTPAYLRTLRTLVLNATADLLSKDEVTADWVQEASGDERASPKAVKQVLDLRFGEKRVAYDPSDPEANAIAFERGYTVIHGGSLSGGQWANAKQAGLVLPSGQVTPSPKPFSADGTPLNTLSVERWTAEQKGFAQFAQWLAKETLGVSIRVVFTDDAGWQFGGAFGPTRDLYVNVHHQLRGPVEVLDFLIHEFGHAEGDHHLSESYHRALTRIGAQTAVALRAEPARFHLIDDFSQGTSKIDLG